MFDSWFFDPWIKEEYKPMVCTTHVSHIPCRRGHVGDEWGIGCEFSTDPYVVAMVGAWHQGWIDERR